MLGSVALVMSACGVQSSGEDMDGLEGSAHYQHIILNGWHVRYRLQPQEYVAGAKRGYWPEA